jgi:20S proteasome alpha/beta subunit
LSLTIALTAADGLVLAADSRTTEGYTLEGPKIRDDSIKFVQLNEYWGVLTYGLSDIGREGITALKEKISKSLGNLTLASVLKESTQIFAMASSDWSKSNSKIGRRDKDVGFVIGGYDQEERGFKVFHFQSPDFLSMRLNGRCLLGGQWHIAKFLVKKVFPEDARMDTLKALAVFLIDATMTVEKTVGGAIRLATVTEPKGFQWVSEGEIKDLSEANRPHLRLFQEHFYASLLSVANGHRRENENSDAYKG